MDRVLVACSVGSTVWLGTEKGTIQVFCALTYKPLAVGRLFNHRYILRIVHSPACHCVLVALHDGSVLGYHDNISAYSHCINQQDVTYYFLTPSTSSPVRELIPNRVYPGDLTNNPIHCLAAVPSRAKSSHLEDVVTFRGSNGLPIAMTTRDHIEEDSSDEEEAVPEKASDNSDSESPPSLKYELWCGQEKGIITVLDVKDLQRVKVLPVKGTEIANPSLKTLSVRYMETMRTYQTDTDTSANETEDYDLSRSENGDCAPSASIWIVVYPGTCVYRWNVDQRKVESSFDATLFAPSNDCK